MAVNCVFAIYFIGANVTEKQGIFDFEAYYLALDSARQARGLTWKQVSEATGVGASTLTRMAKGRRPDADSLASLSAWADLNPAEFVDGGRNRGQREVLSTISACLQSDPKLSKEAAAALDEMIKATYKRLARSE